MDYKMNKAHQPNTNADKIRSMSNAELARERVATFAFQNDMFSPWHFVTSNGKLYKSNILQTDADTMFDKAVQNELEWLESGYSIGFKDKNEK